jgi:RNA polymerase sigma factor (sigma-70 family)
VTRKTSTLTTSFRPLDAAAADANRSDGELVGEFVRHRDQAAFAALVRRHASMVWGVCRRILGQPADIEDAVQATFVLLARKAAELKHPELVGAWLHAVARKVALKARSRQHADHVVATAERVPHCEDPLDVLSGREVLAILDEELARLPEEYRAVLLLCCIEGRSREEAAQRLGWSEGSVKGRLERGRDLLRRRLGRRGLTLGVALGVALMWKTYTARAAMFAIAQGLESATPQAVALANAVAAGTAMWIKWGLVGAMLLTGAGVGLGVWHWGQPEPSPHQQQRVELPNLVSPQQLAPNSEADSSRTSESSPRGGPPAADPRRNIGATLRALLRGVDLGGQEVTLRVREADVTYRLAAGVDIRIDGAASDVAELAALGTAPRATATLNAAGTEVVWLAAEGEIVTGTLHGVNAERNTITVQRSETDPNARPNTWPLASGAMIALDGEPAAIAALRQGSIVSVRLSADGKRVLALEAKSH